MNNDLISRSAVKTYLEQYRKQFSTFNDTQMQIILDVIDHVPAVEEITNEDIQQAIKEGFANGYEMAKEKFSPKKGEWIDTGDMEEYWSEEYQCSVCGAKDHWHNFCPNCGAYMRGAE